MKVEKFNIEQLDLHHWGDDSDWDNNIDGLEILVKAFTCSSLKHSLEEITIKEKWRNIEYREKVKEIFERHDLQDVLELNY